MAENTVPSLAGSQTIDVVLPRTKVPLALRLVGFVFWALLAYLASQLLIVYSENQAILRWWGKGTGVDKKYNDYFNIWLALCAKQSSTFLYYIIWIFVPLTAHQSRAQIGFTTSVLFRFIRIENDDKTQSGIMIPRHLVQSILLQQNDGDLAFNAWYEKNKTKRVLTPDNANDPSTAMCSSSISRTQGGTGVSVTIYTWQPCKNSKDNRIGVYPTSIDRESWKCCIQYWLNGDSGPIKWGWIQTQKAPGENSVYIPGPVDINNPGTLDEWFDIKKHPDNILARYGISPNSPLIIYFANGFYNDDRMVVPSAAFADLVDGSAGAGGWVGFLSGQPDGFGEDEYKELIYSTVNTDVMPPSLPCNTAGRTATSVLGSLAAGLSGLAFLASETAVWPFALVGVLASVGAAVSGYQAYTSSKKDGCT